MTTFITKDGISVDPQIPQTWEEGEEMAADQHTPPPAMTTTLYALTGDALKLQFQIDEAAADLFSDDPAVVAAATATLEGLISVEADNKQAILAKADAWCWVIDSLRTRRDARKARAAALAELAAADEQQADALQDRLIQALQKVDPEATKYDLPEHKLTSRKTTAVDLLAEVADLPEEFQRVKTTYSADKTAIAAALKRGQQIDGCSLVERRSWSIK
jgi:hypothetical protein